MHPHATYWDIGADHVPGMTGAADLLDATDIRDLCAELGIKLPLPNLLDIGCGTGRAALVCDGPYLGLDIAPSCVEYCLRFGRPAATINGAADVPFVVAVNEQSFHWTFALSLFTHMDRAERREYLAAFPSTNLLADILPGDGDGSFPVWTTDPVDFVADLLDARYTVKRSADRTGADGIRHRYYWATRARRAPLHNG